MECHAELAQNEDCLQQLTCLSLSPSVRTLSVQLVATLFLCVAYTPSTHPFLTRPLLIRRLLDACAKDHGDNAEDEQDMLMVK